MAKEKKITVAVAETQSDMDRIGPQWEDEFDTIKQAKAKAQYFLTEEYRNVIETTTVYGYAQVRVNGECLYDFFGRDSESQSREEMRDEHEEYLMDMRHGNG